MASSKEVQTARSLTHRPSLSMASASGAISSGRQSHARTGSHSLLVGSANSHRVSRRKSMTSASANVAAVAAALGEAADHALPLPIAVSSRRISKTSARPAVVGSVPSPPASLPTHKFLSVNARLEMTESAIDDDTFDLSGDEAEGQERKPRARRASDGAPLTKDGRKNNRVELRCEKCGKGYKHSSCLTKHLWEHTPEWSYTSKLLISKHQQVQLLEAASVLVAIGNTKDSMPLGDEATSDQDSASPPASAYSEQHDDDHSSSANTSPPPSDVLYTTTMPYRSKRHSSGSGFSRSYQSAPYNASVAGSAPSASFFSHSRQTSQDKRPLSSGKNTTSREDRELAAATELLSSSFGSTGGSRTVHLPADAPPVPPLPAQYLDQAALSGTSFMNSFTNRATESFARGEKRHDDVKMEGSGESVMDDDEDDLRSRARSDEDYEGVFGRMEE